MADTEEVPSPGSAGSESDSKLTTPDYPTLYQLLSDVDSQLSPADGPYREELRSSSCLVMLYFAKYYLEPAEGYNEQTEIAAIDTYMHARYGIDAIQAVHTRYEGSLADHPSWDVRPYVVARNLTEMALKDLHDCNDEQGVRTLMYVVNKHCNYTIEFDPSAESPLCRENFGDPWFD